MESSDLWRGLVVSICMKTLLAPSDLEGPLLCMEPQIALNAE